MKPPEGFLPFRKSVLWTEGYPTSGVYTSKGEHINEPPVQIADFIIEACNTYESTQAELAQLREELRATACLLNAYRKSCRNAEEQLEQLEEDTPKIIDFSIKFIEEAKRFSKERDLTIIELRGIADALDVSSFNYAAIKLDALLVKLGDLPAAYAKTGGEG